ncbi:MAG: hypothetical protein M1812_004271 [Candelaria pacifica]|nr:MAG: hypothetical protein M1812_004271 [Candelaria pacifica]
MAQHIVDLQSNVHVGLNNLIARETSPHSPRDNNYEKRSPQNKERYAWRLNSSPRDGPNARYPYRAYPTTATREGSPRSRTPDHERALALAMGRSGSAMSTKSDQSPFIFPARLGRQELLSLGRRRKASVPEIGPMTTVQETPLDSHTIPGRPPLHERSSSAPTWRNFNINDGDIPRIEPLETQQQKRRNALLAKTLTPLVIPTRGRKLYAHLRTPSVNEEDVPPEVPPKSARLCEGASPMGKSLETPISAWSTTSSDITYTATPRSAMGSWEPSKPWVTPVVGNSPVEGRRRPCEVYNSSRGRTVTECNGNIQEQADNNAHKRSLSAEERAFQALPLGLLPAEATSRLPRQEIEQLQQQAISQVEQYAVLSAKDVQSLSKELRALDERCDYLRKTHNSLRAGRRSLHGRMIAYLKTPRVAVFTRESLLKQEEALAELDLSIDDWVSKLEKAENRRTRIRQKLLEHVAAASTLGLGERRKQWRPTQEEQTPPRSPEKATTQFKSERQDVQSIKIYADSDVYALLEDVEQEIGNMVKMCLDQGFGDNMF